MQAHINLLPPFDDRQGPMAVGREDTIKFEHGAALVEVNDPAAPLPAGGRLRHIINLLRQEMPYDAIRIDGREVSDYFRQVLGYQFP